MAVFITASDESADQNPRDNFFYGGFAAPLNDWDGPFANAWNERVLLGPPRIPYMHVTDILSPRWRAEEGNGLTESQAIGRLDEAARVIRSMGSLLPVMFYVEEAQYDATLRQPARLHFRRARMDPDYLCFVFYAYTQLKWIHDQYPEVEKVDFWIERNDRVTKFIEDRQNRLRTNLADVGHPELAALIGEVLQVGKERIPVQAADMLMWHARNHTRGTLDLTGTRRYWRMIEGGFGSRLDRGRYGFFGPIPQDWLNELADGIERRRLEANGGASSEVVAS